MGPLGAYLYNSFAGRIDRKQFLIGFVASIVVALFFSLSRQ